MRYLILSDIHSSLEALEKCLAAAQGKYEAAVCLGDVVGYGPDPNAVIDHVREIASATVRGNHDKACCGITNAEDFNTLAREATEWTSDALTPAHTAFLRQLPSGPLLLPGFEIVHGSVEDEDQYMMGPAEAIPALRSQQVQLVFFGHTHHQGGFALDRAGKLHHWSVGSGKEGCVLRLELENSTRYLLNPGSVGQPRDGNWRAAFAIFDETERRVDFYRTEYDLVKTQEKMNQAGLPEPLIRRLAQGR